MPSAIVQDAYDYGTGTSLTVDGTSPNPLAAPTVGNLLVAGLTNASTPGNPFITGFTVYDTIKANTGPTIKAMLAGKIATAGDTSVALGASVSDNLVGHAVEISGMGANPVLESINTPIEVTAGASWSDDIDVVDPDAVIFVLVGFTGGQPGTGKPTAGAGWISTGAVNRYGCLWYRRAGAAGNYPITISWTNQINAYGFMAVIAPTPAGGGGGGGGVAGLRAGAL